MHHHATAYSSDLFHALCSRGCPRYPPPCSAAAPCPPHTRAAPLKRAESRAEHDPAAHSARSALPRIRSAVVPLVRHSNDILGVLQEVKHTGNVDVARQTPKQQISHSVAVVLTRNRFGRRQLHPRRVQLAVEKSNFYFVAFWAADVSAMVISTTLSSLAADAVS